MNLYSTDPPLRNKVHTVVIDPGHGGKDPGAHGRIVREKDIVLNIGLKLGKYIEENFEDVKVIYTRDSDVFIPLHKRAQIANEARADLFISIHANSVPKSRARGTETFVIGRHKDEQNFEVAKKENSVILLEDNYETKYQGFDPNSIDSYIIFSVMQKTYQSHSLALAKLVQDEFEFRAKRINRGVKPAGFVVLWMTTMPSILIETGFLTHPEEEDFLSSEQGQDYLASAIFRAFRQYKTNIEKSSNFESIDSLTVKKNIQDTSELISGASLNSGNETSSENSSFHFKVQVVVSRNQIKTSDEFFKAYPAVEEFADGRWYKYAVGSYSSYEKIQSFCEKVKEDFPDAFVIAVENGEILNLNRVLREKNIK